MVKQESEYGVRGSLLWCYGVFKWHVSRYTALGFERRGNMSTARDRD